MGKQGIINTITLLRVHDTKTTGIIQNVNRSFYKYCNYRLHNMQILSLISSREEKIFFSAEISFVTILKSCRRGDDEFESELEISKDVAS